MLYRLALCAEAFFAIKLGRLISCVMRSSSPFCLRNASPFSHRGASSLMRSYEECLASAIWPMGMCEDKATMLFVELGYTLATEEAERIGVDHIARVTSSEQGPNSTVSEHLTAQHSSIKMLHGRINIILRYIKAMQEGQVPHNSEILREAYSLCHRLPVLSTARFSEEFYNQCNDISLLTYLGTLTKGCNTINQFVNKFNVLYDRQSSGRRMRGLFF